MAKGSNKIDEKMTLEDFIIQNDKLLSVLGVFFAIVAFTKITTNWALSLVTFASLCVLTLVWYEVLNKLNKKITFRLLLFRYALIVLGTGIILYWVSEFRVIWDALLWIPTTFAFFSFIFWSLLPVVRKFRFTRKFFGIDSQKKTLDHKLARVAAIIIIFIASLIYAVPASFALNAIFDAIKK